MKPERQRIKIAEACGIKATKDKCPECYGTGRLGSEGDCWPCPHCHATGRVAPYPCGPNYPNDLNACHEMEKALTDAQHRRFRRKLAEISHDKAGRSLHSRALISATAAQRCEAFLRTLDLWEDE